MNKKLSRLINLCLDKNIPFVSFRLPDEKDIITWVQISGQFNYFESIEKIGKRKGFVYAPFHRRTNFPIAFFEPEVIFKNDEIDEDFIRVLIEKQKLYPDYQVSVPTEIGKEAYITQANSFIGSFDRTFTKAVLSRVLYNSKPESFNPGDLFVKLYEQYPGAFCHLINIPGAGCWTGASPEPLVRVDDKHAYTVSLAGTQKKSGSGISVNWSDKEIEEQNIVSNYIEKLFQQIGIGKYHKEQTKNQMAGGVVHRATRYSFDRTLIENKLAEFIKEFHPTPAVCGMPKEKALDLIMSTEKHNREYYSGYCGVIDPNANTDLFVNLRCMKILPDKMALFVGGGLTAQSIAEKEWEETQWKARTLLGLIDAE